MGRQDVKRLAASQAQYPNNDSASSDGQAAFTALQNNATQNGAMGPASAIALDFPAFTSVGSGKLLITGFISVTDANAGEDVTFTISVDSVVVATTIEESSATSKRASAAMTVLVSTTPGAHSIGIAASATGDLTSVAGHQALSVVELP